MTLLKPLGAGQGYLKAGFLGFQKSGKTFTALELALGTRALMKQDGPIAMFDTEGGSEYVAERVRKETGQDLLGVKSRSFDDLMAMGQECLSEGVSVLIVDSVTHVWRELQDAYLKKVNARLKQKGKPGRFNLEFQDWNPIKAQWSTWTDFYLNSKLHIVICGRAGFEYGHEENQSTGKKELIKTGVKMRVESEFGFEPSLLVELERVQEDHRIVHRATVLGDRFGVVDGQTCDNPTFEFFLPHVKKLKPGAHTPIDTETKSDVDVDEDGRDSWYREKREREIFAEEIQGELLRLHPTQGAADKAAKLDLLEKYFNTRSWTKVENMNSATLKAGLDQMRKDLRPPAPRTEEEDLPEWAGGPDSPDSPAPSPAQPAATPSATGPAAGLGEPFGLKSPPPAPKDALPAMTPESSGTATPTDAARRGVETAAVESPLGATTAPAEGMSGLEMLEAKIDEADLKVLRKLETTVKRWPVAAERIELEEKLAARKAAITEIR
jgi:hypothetical protein